MERRLVIKQVLIMAGGMALLPSCLRDSGKSTIALHQISISLVQEHLLAEIAETLIPRTKTPGAKELKLHLFVLKMVDDCCTKEEQSQFIAGIDAFKDLIYDRYSKSFEKLSRQHQQDVLTAIQNDKATPPALAAFYRIMKNRTIDGYLNSQYVMTKLIVYELVPGRYNGYFPVKTA